ncbi:MAG TPA: ATP-binding protein, partial [Geobacterales bacterium]|nr:ATP-binding protein [Geobacterales bacterium]
CHDVLLWGERGSGKSSSVKGLLRLFADKGLRLVELQRQDLLTLPTLMALLRPLPFRFIVFCDDLSFDEGEGEYRELKAFLDGGIEERPGNVRFYATSNRRHLIPERFDDQDHGEIHPEEGVAEKLSLADRFGLTLGFYSFDQQTYLAIVDRYAQREGVVMEREELHQLAVRWAMRRGQRSGRAARQFVDDLAGRQRLALLQVTK